MKRKPSSAEADLSTVAVAKELRRPRRRMVVIIIVLALLLAVALTLARRSRGRRNAEGKTIETAAVMAADFDIALTVEGVLEAARSTPVINTIPETQIVSVLPDGTKVQPGDIIMTLNDSEIKQKVDSLRGEVAEQEDNIRQEDDRTQRELRNAESSVEKAEDALALAREQGRTGVEKAQAEVSFLEKELEVAQGQLDRRKRLLDEQLLPVTEVEAAEDEVREREFSLEAARRSLERAQEDADITVELRRMEVQKAKLELQQAESGREASMASVRRNLSDKQRDLQEMEGQLAEAKVKAPAAGLLLLEQTWDDGRRAFRIGDRVGEGQRVASIIESKEMLLRCDIGETDIELVRAGCAARVRVPALGSESPLDSAEEQEENAEGGAMPSGVEAPLAGEVELVTKIARQDSPWRGGVPGKKVFSAIIAIKEPNPRLRPGMGATADIVVEHVGSGLAIPVESLFREKGRHLVYVMKNGKYRPVEVTPGKRNSTLVSVEGKLAEGDKVACEGPSRELTVTEGEAT